MVHDHRQPSRVPGEGGDPLEDGQARAQRGHGAEVAGGGSLEVDLGRHRPLARGVLDEAAAHVVDRLQRIDGAQHGVVVEDGDLGHQPGYPRVLLR